MFFLGATRRTAWHGVDWRAAVRGSPNACHRGSMLSMPSGGGEGALLTGDERYAILALSVVVRYG